jgi:hypothetical protein
MMPNIQIISFLYEIERGKNGVWSKKEREREREKTD